MISIYRALTEFGIALILDTNCFLVLVEQDSDDLLFAHDVQVGIVAALELVVHVAMCCILPTPVGAGREEKKGVSKASQTPILVVSSDLSPNVFKPPLCGIVRVEVLQVFELAVAHLVRRVDE